MAGASQERPQPDWQHNACVGGQDGHGAKWHTVQSSSVCLWAKARHFLKFPAIKPAKAGFSRRHAILAPVSSRNLRVLLKFSLINWQLIDGKICKKSPMIIVHFSLHVHLGHVSGILTKMQIKNSLKPIKILPIHGFP